MTEPKTESNQSNSDPSDTTAEHHSAVSSPSFSPSSTSSPSPRSPTKSTPNKLSASSPNGIVATKRVGAKSTLQASMSNINENDDTDDINTSLISTASSIGAASTTSEIIESLEMETNEIISSLETETSQQKQDHELKEQQQQSSPTSVLLEETYRTLDVTKVLFHSNKRTSNKKSSTKMLSSSPPPPATNINNSTTSTRSSPPPKEDADILMDAFETMTDIAVGLFNNDTNDDTDDDDSYENDKHSHFDDHHHNRDNDNNDSNIGAIEIENDTNAPFDEQGLVSITPICNNRKSPVRHSQQHDPNRDADHASCKHSTNSDKESSVAAAELAAAAYYKRKQTKWTKLKIIADQDKNDVGGVATEDHQSSSASNFGSFMDMTKDFADVMYQSQTMILDAILGSPDPATAKSARGSRKKNNDDYSDDSDASYDSEDYDDESLGESLGESYCSEFSASGESEDDGNNNVINNKLNNNKINSEENSNKVKSINVNVNNSILNKNNNNVKSNTNRNHIEKKVSFSSNVHISGSGDLHNHDHQSDFKGILPDPKCAIPSNHLQQFLHEITNIGTKLTWHKPMQAQQSIKTIFNSGGIDVNVSIQISNQKDNDNNIINKKTNANSGSNHNVEPNLYWEILGSKKKMEETANITTNRYQDAVKSVRHRLSLFDIVSVQKACLSMNLYSFPQAAMEKSILITSHDSSMYFFEAETAEKADLVVHGLRWISARLVFNLLAGNSNICSEILPMVPGGDRVFSSDVMRDVTDHLVDKSMMRLSERCTLT